MAKEKQCTPKQLAFIEEYMRNGYDETDAYVVAYDKKNRLSAYKDGRALLRLPWVRDEIMRRKKTLETLAMKKGMSDSELLDQHKKLIFATKKVVDAEGNIVSETDDLSMVKQGLELIYKLLGKFPAERRQLEGPGGKSLFADTDFSGMSKEELIKRRDELMGSVGDD